jgi:hypothetical protein
MEKKLRGLAALPPERRKEIARLGALALHKKGLAHIWTQEEASIASLKGWGKEMKVVVESESEEVA